MIIERARALRSKLEKMAESLNDESALDVVEFFPQWETEKEYSVGDRIRYKDILYKCVQAHTSQNSWLPDLTPALWTRVSIDEFPEWIQPTGVQDAYATGDKVTHHNTHWISIVDNNVWEPGVYGWEEVIE